MSDVSRPGAPIKARISSSSHFAAGLISGLTSAILLQPADLLKTRVQQSRQHGSLLGTLRVILSSPQPIRGLWRGTLPSALRTGFGSALYFTGLNGLRNSIASYGPSAFLQSRTAAEIKATTSTLPNLSHSANLLTGAVARVTAGFIMMPVTVLKVRYESNFYSYGGLFSAGKDIMRTEGFRGLFAGFGATAVRDAPYAGLYVVFYEQLKRTLATFDNIGLWSVNGDIAGTKRSVPINFISGGLAAGLATAITNPFDVVKTRLQLMPSKYCNMIHAFNIMLREDGLRSFFDGLGLRIGRKALSSALAWTVYEELMLAVQRRGREDDRRRELA
ncbi:solute carrier family 25 member 38 [Ascosphaera apis ARSEF 7405]|uniref:Mitochondrial glycine transporter n=1 Tax=Ascosphaera apis ARSEF 7405 TaxID=392613 RepID=A0A167V2F9_9EURO|nr:solute carrier family 25 member 38 [Ascosphaera apis ARSEF 7405]